MRRLGWLGGALLLCGAAPFWGPLASLTPEAPHRIHDEVGAWLRAVSRGWVVEEQLSRDLRDTREALFTLDLKRLYQKLPGEGEVHSLQVEGHPLADGYHFQAGSLTPLQLGALTVDLALAPMASESNVRTWAAHPRMGLGAGSVAPEPLTIALTDFFSELESAALQSEDADEGVRTALCQAFPHTCTALDPLVDLEHIAAPDPVALQLNVGLSLSSSGFTDRGYPQLARYLERLDDLLHLEVQFLDDAGRTYLDAALDTAALSLALRARYDDGAFVPWGQLGPEPQAGIPLSGAHSLTLRMAGTVRAEGVVLDLPRWEVPLDLVFDPGKARADVRLDNVPDLRISGGGPTMDWLVGLANSALGLEDKGRALFEGLAQGPAGDGSTVSLSLSAEEPVLWLEAHLKLLEEGLVRLALRITARRLLPDAQATADLSRGLSVLAAGLEQDRVQAENALVE